MADAEVRRLEGELQRCIAAEEFEAAATVRDALRSRRAELVSTQARLQALEAELKALIEEMEFERAAAVRDAIRDLKRAQEGVSAAEIQRLEADLMRLKAEERYEEAAVVRDRLRAVRGTGSADRLPVAAAAPATVPPPVSVPMAHEATAGARKASNMGAVSAPRAVPAAGPLSAHRPGLPKPPTQTTAAPLTAPASVPPPPGDLNPKVMLNNWHQRVGHVAKYVTMPCTEGFHSTLTLPLEGAGAAATCSAVGASPRIAETLCADQAMQKLFELGLLTILTESRKKPAKPSKPSGSNTAPAGKRVFSPDERARTVILLGCPLTVTEETLAAKFPSAEEVTLSKRDSYFSGIAFLRFKTAEEAHTIAKAERVEIAGRSVRARMRDAPDTPEETETRTREESLKQVFLCGLPSDVTEEDVLQLFPGAEAADLLYKGRAVVFFSTPAEAQAAVGVEVAVKGARVTPTAFRTQGKPRSSEKRKLEDPTPTPRATAGPKSNKPPGKKLKTVSE